MGAPLWKRWTSEEDQRLKELEAKGWSATLIGQAMGKTRAAVVGRSYRMRGAKRRKASGIAPKPPTTMIAGSRNPPRTPKPAPPKPIGDGRPRMISFFDLDHTTCKWPFGERAPYLFCGQPQEPNEKRLPYCTEHMKLRWRRLGAQ